MFNVLQARKVPSKLLMFPDENHVSWPFMKWLWEDSKADSSNC